MRRTEGLRQGWVKEKHPETSERAQRDRRKAKRRCSHRSPGKTKVQGGRDQLVQMLPGGQESKDNKVSVCGFFFF